MTISQARKYIFCVSPGRSGSHYLYHVFSCGREVCATHEPEHEYTAYAQLRPQLWDLKNRPFPSSLAMRRNLKLSQISDLCSLSNTGIYAETNPLFSTLWHDAILSEFSGQDVTVIILRRNAPEVLKSILDLGWFHARNGNDWMVSAYSVNSLIRPVVLENEASPFDLIAGHLLNVEYYAQQIKRQCQEHGHRVIELHSDELFGNLELIVELLDRCGLCPDARRLKGVIDGKKNKASTRSKGFNFPLKVCTKELDLYLRRCRDKRIDVPESFYFRPDAFILS